ncbi:MAG: DHHA1 domain-containing protein, partial [Actinomycetota bacterium]|nr:DHHA1 domain-containing protein [Actinomycetota bacterium]
GRLGTGRPVVVAIIGAVDDKPSVVVAVNDHARERGLSAGRLVRVAATRLGGNGGGKDDIAQGGGTDASAAPEALTELETAISQAAEDA